jgi:hypothetical protein
MRRAVEIDTNRLACPSLAPQSLLLFNNMHFLSVLTAATLAGAALAFPKEVFPRLPYRMLQLTFQHGHQGNDSCGVYGYFSPQYEFIENVGTMKTVGNSTICDIPGMLTSLSLKSVYLYVLIDVKQLDESTKPTPEVGDHLTLTRKGDGVVMTWDGHSCTLPTLDLNMPCTTHWWPTK